MAAAQIPNIPIPPPIPAIVVPPAGAAAGPNWATVTHAFADLAQEIPAINAAVCCSRCLPQTTHLNVRFPKTKSMLSLLPIITRSKQLTRKILQL
jgi:hypothetical protein